MADNQVTEEELQRMWDEELTADKSAASDPVPEEPVQETPETPEVTEQVPETPDPVAELAEIKKSLEKFDALERRLRNTEGHIGGISSKIEQMHNEVRAAKAVADQTAGPSQKQIDDAAKSLEKWNRLKVDYPEWGEAFEELLESRKAPEAPDINALREQMSRDLSAQLSEKIRSEIAAEFEQKLVDVAHRGWRTLVNTDEFRQWFSTQDEETQRLSQSPKAADAIEMIDRFKSAKPTLNKTAAEIEAERRGKLKAAAVLPRGGSATPNKTPDQMTDAEYWDYLARKK